MLNRFKKGWCKNLPDYINTQNGAKASLNDSILHFASIDVKVVTISYILIIKDFVPEDMGTTVLLLIVSDSHFCLGIHICYCMYKNIILGTLYY